VRSTLRAALIALAAIAAFAGYYLMARTMPINADGASNALQAWEMLHGNPILRGWTVTDVSFYTTELMQYALIETFTGLNENVFRIACAMTYTLILFLTAFLAKGESTGRAAFLRIGIAAAILLLPMPGAGYLVAFGGPNHLGTSVPLLVLWLTLDCGRARPWLPFAVSLILIWGQIGDPLVLFIGVLPVVAVCLYRLLRSRDWRGTDARLILAAAVSVPIGQGTLKLIDAAGGFVAHAPPTHFASPSEWPSHLKLLGDVMAVNYGAYLPDAANPLDFTISLLRIAGLVLALAAIALVTGTIVKTFPTLLRRPPLTQTPPPSSSFPHTLSSSPRALAAGFLGDRTDQVLAVAAVTNLVAFVASTLPTDLMSARQVAVVLPLGAALAARVFAPRLLPEPLPTNAASPAALTETDLPTGSAPAAFAAESRPDSLLADTVTVGSPAVQPQPADAPDSFAAGGLMAGESTAGYGSAGSSGAGERGSRMGVFAGDRRSRVVTGTLAAVLVLFAGVFVWHASGKPWQEPKRELVAWLESKGLTHGVGGYWQANDLSLISQGRVTVAPVTGGDEIKGMRWESRADWYDPAKYDARFIVIDVTRPGLGTIDVAVSQFGEPTETKEFAQFRVLVYSKDLLEGLKADCGSGRVTPSMYDCLVD
jgi:hypothetical protein